MAEKELQGLALRWKAHFPEVDASTVEPLARLSAIGRLLERFHRETLRGFGLQRSDYQVLSALLTLASADGFTPTRLSEILLQTPAGMTKTLDRLAERGAVRRVASPTDRRSICIELTARGKRLAERACLAELEAQKDLFGGFGVRELAHFNGLLSRLLETLERE